MIEVFSFLFRSMAVVCRDGMASVGAAAPPVGYTPGAGRVAVAPAQLEMMRRLASSSDVPTLLQARDQMQIARSNLPEEAQAQLSPLSVTLDRLENLALAKQPIPPELMQDLHEQALEVEKTLRIAAGDTDGAIDAMNRMQVLRDPDYVPPAGPPAAPLRGQTDPATLTGREAVGFLATNTDMSKILDMYKNVVAYRDSLPEDQRAVLTPLVQSMDQVMMTRGAANSSVSPQMVDDLRLAATQAEEELARASGDTVGERSALLRKQVVGGPEDMAPDTALGQAAADYAPKLQELVDAAPQGFTTTQARATVQELGNFMGGYGEEALKPLQAGLEKLEAFGANPPELAVMQFQATVAQVLQHMQAGAGDPQAIEGAKKQVESTQQQVNRTVDRLQPEVMLLKLDVDRLRMQALTQAPAMQLPNSPQVMMLQVETNNMMIRLQQSSQQFARPDEWSRMDLAKSMIATGLPDQMAAGLTVLSQLMDERNGALQDLQMQRMQ